MEPYSFGDVLRQLRTDKKMTQKQLAKKVNLSVTAISKYELGEAYPAFETLRSFAVIFNVSADKLFGFESRDKLSMFGLNEAQSQILYELAELFREQNSAGKNKISSRQYEMLGKIAISFIE